MKEDFLKVFIGACVGSVIGSLITAKRYRRTIQEMQSVNRWAIGEMDRIVSDAERMINEKAKPFDKDTKVYEA